MYENRDEPHFLKRLVSIWNIEKENSWMNETTSIFPGVHPPVHLGVQVGRDHGKV